MTTTHPTTEAFASLVVAANDIRQALSMINRYGDDFDRNLALQADGHAYGELHDGLKSLVRTLYPDTINGHTVTDRATRILEGAFDGDIEIARSARYVAEQHAPMAGWSASDIREELAKYKAWLQALHDGVLDVSKVVGVVEGDPAEEAERWLLDRVNECDAALAYRNEPEVAPDA